MLIGTHHGTILSINPPYLYHSHLVGIVVPLRFGRPHQVEALIGAMVEGGACQVEGHTLRITQFGEYISAHPDGTLRRVQHAPGDLETFHLLSDEAAHWLGYSDSNRAELLRFSRAVDALQTSDQAVKVQFGAGTRIIDGFLNVDIEPRDDDAVRQLPDNKFVFPYVGVHIPISGEIVDYIFHEDFFEHIDQLQQIQFLAETRRLLKPGGVHRISTPDLAWKINRLSDFSQGIGGVYSGEICWGHIGLVTRGYLKEIALMAGYSEVVFGERNASISRHAVEDMRPFWDSDPRYGNIYVDLRK